MKDSGLGSQDRGPGRSWGRAAGPATRKPPRWGLCHLSFLLLLCRPRGQVGPGVLSYFARPTTRVGMGPPGGGRARDGSPNPETRQIGRHSDECGAAAGERSSEADSVALGRLLPPPPRVPVSFPGNEHVARTHIPGPSTVTLSTEESQAAGLRWCSYYLLQGG